MMSLISSNCSSRVSSEEHLQVSPARLEQRSRKEHMYQAQGWKMMEEARTMKE